MLSSTMIAIHDVTLDIGGIPILVRTDSADFASLLADRYGEFVAIDAPAATVELEVRLIEKQGLGVTDSGSGVGDPVVGGPSVESESLIPNPQPLMPDPDAEVSVRRESGRWVMERGDFRAEWDPETRRGWVRQTANPYSIDGVLRILHSLILARDGGLLVHAASAVRNGRAFVFAGVSGTGKTTISRLAPPDVTLLTDEITYLRETGYGTRDTGRRTPVPEPPAPIPQSPEPAFQAYGTPFAGELARIGKKTRAPLATLFLLQQGPENRIEPVSEGQAARELMRHVLFFAHDTELVGMVFDTVCDFVRRVQVRRLVFTRDARVWDLIE
ncbi:MAG: hypothetical protein ACLQVG_28995 [Terriglobia bacterium]